MHCGEEDRWQYVVLGPEVENTYAADRLNVPGMIIIFYYPFSSSVQL